MHPTGMPSCYNSKMRHPWSGVPVVLVTIKLTVILFQFSMRSSYFWGGGVKVDHLKTEVFHRVDIVEHHQSEELQICDDQF